MSSSIKDLLESTISHIPKNSQYSVSQKDLKYCLANIIGKKKDGFEWIFLCLQCVRDWRQRGLEREGTPAEDIEAILDKEYPFLTV